MAQQAVLAITTSDRKFLLRAKRQLRIRGRVRLAISDSKRRWPDIWVRPGVGGAAAVITVTAEWRRQSASERQKRLVHELLHTLGLRHGRIGGLMYSTHPEKDTYSRAVYNQLMRRLRSPHP